MYTKERHIIYKRLKTTSLTVSTVTLSHTETFCKWFLFPSSGGKNVSTLTHGPSQASSHFQVLLLSHHFNTVLAPCPGISNCLLRQTWQAKLFYSFLPLTSTHDKG